jgi:hypothetical protein
MANCYVSARRGDDAAGDGSATHPWRTIARAIGPSPAFALDPASPNTLYIEPGVYREAVALGVSPTASGPLAIVGDSDGAGFAAGGYPTPAAGLVDWRAWSDDVTPIAGNCLSASGRGYVELRNLKLIGGGDAYGCVNCLDSVGWSIRDCIVASGYMAGIGLYFRAVVGAALDVTIERCTLHSSTNAGNGVITFQVPLDAAEWPLGAVIRNCLFIGASYGVQFYAAGGSGGHLGAGASIQNCTFDVPLWALKGYGAALASPIRVNGCVCLGCSLYTDAAGEIVEDGNVFMQSPSNHNTNVAAGAHSILRACPAFDLGDGRLTGLPYRHPMTPSAAGAIVGFGAYGAAPADDLAGRSRPEGAGSTAPSAGCLERHDTGVQDFTHQDADSPACLALVGPSSQDRLVLVDPVSTTLSVKVRWDGNHGDANRPQAVLIAEPQIGVAGQVVTATSTGGTGSTPNAYETLTFAPFTPTGPGAVMLRMVSRAAAGDGAAYFDTITLS